jgi:hypothetical protein
VLSPIASLNTPLCSQRKNLSLYNAQKTSHPLENNTSWQIFWFKLVNEWGGGIHWCKGFVPLGCGGHSYTQYAHDHSSLSKSHWHRAWFLVSGTITFHWRAASALEICNYSR